MLLPAVATIWHVRKDARVPCACRAGKRFTLDTQSVFHPSLRAARAWSKGVQ